MTADIERMRTDANAWLFRGDGKRVTRTEAVGEESLALDIVEACDEIEKLRSGIPTGGALSRDIVRKAIDRGLSSWFDTMTATGFEAVDRATDHVMAELKKAGAK